RSRGALVRRRRGGGDGRVRAVGGDEVDERLGVLYVQQIVVPAPVRLEVVVAAVSVELGARRVQGRNAGIAAARDVEGRQVERQAEQIVTHGFRHELVDLLADLAGGAARDGAGRLRGRQRAVIVEGERVEEGLDQAEVAGDEVRVEAVDVLVQHGVAEGGGGGRGVGGDRRPGGGVGGPGAGGCR